MLIGSFNTFFDKRWNLLLRDVLEEKKLFELSFQGTLRVSPWSLEKHHCFTLSPPFLNVSPLKSWVSLYLALPLSMDGEVGSISTAVAGIYPSLPPLYLFLLAAFFRPRRCILSLLICPVVHLRLKVCPFSKVWGFHIVEVGSTMK